MLKIILTLGFPFLMWTISAYAEAAQLTQGLCIQLSMSISSFDCLQTWQTSLISIFDKKIKLALVIRFIK